MLFLLHGEGFVGEFVVFVVEVVASGDDGGDVVARSGSCGSVGSSKSV